MIDIELVKKARFTNKIITEIDSSWRIFCKQQIENSIQLPFEDTYNAIIKEDFILIEGYSGLLSIEKILDKKQLYKIKNPLLYTPYKIYGLYNKKAEFMGFTTDPLFGFHYNGEHFGIKLLCTGDLEFKKPTSKKELMEVSYELIKSFKIINMNSMGTTYFPSDIPEIYASLSGNGIQKFLDSKLIEEINYFGEE